MLRNACSETFYTLSFYFSHRFCSECVRVYVRACHANSLYEGPTTTIKTTAAANTVHKHKREYQIQDKTTFVYYAHSKIAENDEKTLHYKLIWSI